jgi:nitroreductase
MDTTTDNQLDFLFGRRSIRVYSPGDISPDEVTQILQAAMAAPSAMTKDPWRFIVVRDRQTLGQLAAVLPGGKMLATAALAIVVCGDQQAAFEQQVGYLLQDCSAAIENLLLAAHALGLGACWVGVHPSEDSARQLRGMFSLPSPILPLAVISLGRPGETPEPRTRYQAEFVRFEKWSA